MYGTHAKDKTGQSSGVASRVGLQFLLLAVFAVYVTTLVRQSLWADEGLSVVFASRPLPQLMHTLIYEDLHPPLYYWVLHFWMIVAGKSEWAVRFPSMAAAVTLVPLSYVVVREIACDEDGDRLFRGAGLVAAALVGTSPFVAHYAQETRMYSMAAAFTLAATWAFLRAINTDRRSWWIAFSALMAASLYTNYFTVLVAPAMFLYALILDRRILSRAITFGGLAGVLFLPWVRPAYLQIQRLMMWPDYWTYTRIDVTTFLTTIGRTLLPNATMRSAVLLAAVLGIVAIRLLLSHPLRASGIRRRTLFVAATFVIPLVLTYAMVVIAPKFATRYLIVAAAPLYITLAVVVYRVFDAWRATRIAFFVVALGVLVVSTRSTIAVVEGEAERRDDARSTAAYLTENVQPGDVLLLVENAPYVLQYYYQGEAPIEGLHVGQQFEHAADRLNQLLAARPRRIWLVLWRKEFADPTDMVVTELLRTCNEVPIPGQFAGYEVRAFDPGIRNETIAAAPDPGHPLDVRFASGLCLDGFDRLMNGDGRLHYVFYWRAERALMENYSVTFSLVDSAGNEYLRRDEALCTDYFLPPVWPIDTVIRGRVDITLPADLPPLDYRGVLKVFDPTTRRNVDIVDAQGARQGQELMLDVLSLTKADLAENWGAIDNAIDAPLSENLSLAGYSVPRRECSQGESIALTLWLRTENKTSNDESVTLRLVGAEGQESWQTELQVIPGHPVTAWSAGEINRVIYRCQIPPDTSEGGYELRVAADGHSVSLGVLRINATEHQFTVPEMDQALDASFGDNLILLGYDLDSSAIRPGGAAAFTLYWQSGAQLDVSYKVSVQLLAVDSRVIAQDDSIPAKWTRPTTTWLPGEVVADPHVLQIGSDATPGAYSIIVVVYNEADGERLTVADTSGHQDHLVLTQIKVPD